MLLLLLILHLLILLLITLLLILLLLLRSIRPKSLIDSAKVPLRDSAKVLLRDSAVVKDLRIQLVGSSPRKIELEYTYSLTNLY